MRELIELNWNDLSHGKAVELMTEGIPPEFVSDMVAPAYGMTLKDFHDYLGVHVRTHYLKVKKHEKYTGWAAERIIRFQRAFSLAILVFGNAVNARSWMISRQKCLSDLKPIECLTSEIGAEQVVNRLMTMRFCENP